MTKAQQLSRLFTALALCAAPGLAQASPDPRAQVCSLGATAVGQPGQIVCVNGLTGQVTQTVVVGRTVSAAGGIAGNLARLEDDRLLVTNQAGGALLFAVDGGWLNRRAPIALGTRGEDSLSGALTRKGSYVLTGQHLFFYRDHDAVASSSRALLVGDGSAAQVSVGRGYAYVSEKGGSLEAFPLDGDGNLIGAAQPVAGIPAGVIVGITASAALDLVVAPVAHLAGNPAVATIPVASGLTEVQNVPTKEAAACWTAHEDNAVCVTNPGSGTISCGHLGRGGFTSYTSAAASPGEKGFDIDMRRGLVAIQATSAGAPRFLVYAPSDEGSDFLTKVNEVVLDPALAFTGVALLPAL